MSVLHLQPGYSLTFQHIALNFVWTPLYGNIMEGLIYHTLLYWYFSLIYVPLQHLFDEPMPGLFQVYAHALNQLPKFSAGAQGINFFCHHLGIIGIQRVD